MKHTELEIAGSDPGLHAEVAALRAENTWLRRLLLPTRAQRVWDGMVNGAVGTLLGVAVALALARLG
jgi:hypothetical protein